jgi:hypothetical protein
VPARREGLLAKPGAAVQGEVEGGLCWCGGHTCLCFLVAVAGRLL